MARYKECAPSRSAMAAPFFTFRERVERTFPPLTCFSGQSPSQDANAELTPRPTDQPPRRLSGHIGVEALNCATSVPGLASALFTVIETVRNCRFLTGFRSRFRTPLLPDLCP